MPNDRVENTGAQGSQQQNITVVNAGNVCALAVFKQGDDFEVFEERLDQYLAANLVENTRKVAVLLTLLSEDVYKILRNLCSPDKPSSKNYDDLMTLLGVYFKPRLSVYRRRVVFDSLKQGQESINDWYLKVKNVAAQCDFGNYLLYRVQEKFVTGMRPGPILDRLCEEKPSRPFNEILEIALDKEAALKEQGRDSIEVNKLQKFRNKNSTTGLQSEGEKFDKEADLKCNFCNKNNHNFSKCKYRKFTCKKCGKKGHIMAACKGRVNFIDEVESSEEETLPMFNLTDFQNVNFVRPLCVPVLLDKVAAQMELDTGAGVSCLPYSFYKKYLSHVPLQATTVKLRTYSGEIVIPEGKICINICIQNLTKSCDLQVVKSATKILLGRDIIKTFDLSLKDLEIVVNKVDLLDCSTKLSQLLSEYSDLFTNELGTYRGEKIKLEIDEKARPVFHKPHPIPFAFRDKVKAELDRLQSEQVIEKIDNSRWGTPLVPVLKANGKDIRVCSNYKITVNKFLKDFNHPLPRIEDIFVALQGGQKFTKLDFLNAYNQLVLDDETSELLAWSTPWGIYKVKRLPYGTKPACSIFQNIVEKVLQGCTGTVNFLDDVVVTGKDDNEHLQNLEQVLKRLYEAGFKLNKKKCSFFKDSIFYLGHKISGQGLEKDQEKVRAIINSPRPKNITEVRAWAGMINYYSRFCKNLQQRLTPLYDLIGKGKEFRWTRECENAFNYAKQELVSDRILVHYDPNKPVRLACDSSEYGIGAVLLHVMEDGSERPICYISRVLTKAERGYSMIMKEALAVYWSVLKLYQYLAGRKFQIVSDHKPLQALFGEHKSLPKMAAGRIQRWSLFLAGFDYSFHFIRGSENVKADALSRLPLSESIDAACDPEYDYLNMVEGQLPIDSSKIRYETRKDSCLGTVFNYIRYGFPKYTENDLLKPYFIRKNELSIEQGIIMWGYRIVIPFGLRGQLLEELHSNHEGITKMKANARSYFWWPSLDAEIEQKVNGCNICCQVRSNPPKAKLEKHPVSNYFFEKIHSDFLGPIRGKMILIIVDTYSKWPEAFLMNSTDSETTVNRFRECFSRYGIPRTVETDNGSQYTSEEFCTFLSKNGVRFVTSPPNHPATNGFAENSVKSLKNGLRKALLDPKNQGLPLETLLYRYLFSYRNSVHSTTGMTPSSMVFKNKIKTRLDLLSPKGVQVMRQTEKQVANHKGSREDIFVEGDRVWCRDYRNPNRRTWAECTVVEVVNERIYFCKVVNEDLVWKRHLNQIRRSLSETNDYSLDLKEYSGQQSPDKFSLNDNISHNRNCLEPVSGSLVNSDANEPTKDLSLCKPNISSNLDLSSNNAELDSPRTEMRSPEVRATTNERPKRLIRPPLRLNL